MANMSLFRSYGAKETKPTATEKRTEELEIMLEEATPVKPTSQEQHVEEKIVKSKPVAKQPQETVTKQTSPGRGRPKKNVGVNILTRTYKLPEEAVMAMEDKFFENRRVWGKEMNFSKYLSNLIWADTHDGEVLYDENTGELLVDLQSGK